MSSRDLLQKEIDRIDSICDWCRKSCNQVSCYNCASFYMKPALDKQIPKKPTKVETYYADNLYTCSSCGQQIWDRFDYCPYCGHAIAWPAYKIREDRRNDV